MSKPSKPTTINGEHEAMWNFLEHLNNRVDKLFLIMLGGIFVGLTVLVESLLRG